MRQQRYRRLAHCHQIATQTASRFRSRSDPGRGCAVNGALSYHERVDQPADGLVSPGLPILPLVQVCLHEAGEPA